MKSSASKIQLTAFNDLFQANNDAEVSGKRVQEVSLSKLFPFKNHPFQVRDDEAMQKTADSIAKHGVLVPGIVRPRQEGGYEIVAGHRRKRGSELAGRTTTMQTGYSQLSNIIVPYIINKAPQTCDAPTLASATTTSLTLNTVSNAEYSKDGENWQSSPEFRSLEPGMTYTLYQRLKATADGNYDVSPAASACGDSLPATDCGG